MTPAARVARFCLALLAFLAVGAVADPGVAAAACPTPWQGTTTCIYQAHTGPLTVPAGVTSINITMSGGGGGGINRGGCAGVIKGVLPTNPGEQLSVIKGGEGNANFMGPGAGGAGGGGAGGNAYYPGSPDGSGSGGGGGSFLFGPQGMIMAAGGGGGESGNGSYGGSVAGVTATFCPGVGAGQTGSGGCGAGGQPGTGSAGGQGGIVEAGCEGSAGTNGGGPASSTSSLGTGGTGGAGTLGTASSTGTGGGGGGGGYYGGGAGAGVDNTSPNDISGGGGAGSNYGNPKLLASYTITNTSNQANGYVDLSYTSTPPLIVNSTGDQDDTATDLSSGVCNVNLTGPQACTLRAAIEVANQQGGGTITFDIPQGSGNTFDGSVPDVKVAADSVEAELPDLTSPTVIDGTTQPGSGEIELREYFEQGVHTRRPDHLYPGAQTSWPGRGKRGSGFDDSRHGYPRLRDTDRSAGRIEHDRG